MATSFKMTVGLAPELQAQSSLAYITSTLFSCHDFLTMTVCQPGFGRLKIAPLVAWDYTQTAISIWKVDFPETADFDT